MLNQYFSILKRVHQLPKMINRRVLKTLVRIANLLAAVIDKNCG